MKFNRDMLQKALAKKMFHWVNEAMRDILPTDIYATAHCGTPEERNRATGWLKEHGYRIVSPGDGVVQVFRGTELLRQTRLVLEMNDPEELLRIAEVVKENVNIPPPPWQPKNA